MTDWVDLEQRENSQNITQSCPERHVGSLLKITVFAPRIRKGGPGGSKGYVQVLHILRKILSMVVTVEMTLEFQVDGFTY